MYKYFFFLFILMSCKDIKSLQHCNMLTVEVSQSYINYLDSIKYPNLKPKWIQNQYDAFIYEEEGRIERIKFNVNELNIDLAKIKPRYVKIGFINREKYYTIYLEKKCGRVSLEKDTNGIFLISKENDIEIVNWHYDLNKSRVLDENYWDKSIHPFFKIFTTRGKEDLTIKDIEKIRSDADNQFKDDRVFLKKLTTKVQSEIKVLYKKTSPDIIAAIEGDLKSFLVEHYLKKDALQREKLDKTYIDSIFSFGVFDEKCAIINVLDRYHNIKNFNTAAGYIELFDKIDLMVIDDKIKYYFKRELLLNSTVNFDMVEIKKLIASNLILQELRPEFNSFIEDSNLDESYSSDMMLINNKRDTSFLKEVLKKNDNTIYYVDFWASWCAPCRAAIPNSKNLANRLKDKNVKFIYLAYKDKYSTWQGAASKLGILDYPSSFWMANSLTSSLVKQLKINNIPRYIIMDSKGNVLNSNAPPPDSPDIIPVLTKMSKN